MAGADHYQVVVLGGGPGGYPAAFGAADHGMKVALVNDEPRPGGVCLHRGCIPSKALLHVAKLINEAQESSHWGVTYGKPKIDVDQLRKFKNGVIDKLVGGIGELSKARGVELIQARGTFVDSHTMKLVGPDKSERKITFDHAIVATGSSPIVPLRSQCLVYSARP